MSIIKKEVYLKSAELAGDWLANHQQVKDPEDSVYGAFSYVYNTKSKMQDCWYFSFDIGVDISALAKLYKILPKESYLESIKIGADFLLKIQVKDKEKPDYGCIKQRPGDRVNYPADASYVALGLLDAYQITSKKDYLFGATIMANWLLNKARVKSAGFSHSFLRDYNQFNDSRALNPGLHIPFIYRIYKITKDKKYKDEIPILLEEIFSHYTKSDGRFLGEVIVKGWQDTGKLNIRYENYVSWGVADAYKEFKNKQYLEYLIKAGEWLIKAQNYDGTFLDNAVNKTFGDGAGVGMSIITWMKLYHFTHEKKWINAAKKSADWIIKHQVTKTEDLNALGGVPYTSSDQLTSMSSAFAIMGLLELTK